MNNEELKNLSDEELACLACEGNSAAEECLLASYKQKVRAKAHLYFILGADSEDVVQEGMIGLVKAIRTYSNDRGASFSTYAEKCISSHILNAVKLAARNKHIPLNSAVSLQQPVDDDEEKTVGDTIAAGSASDPENELLFAEFSEAVFSDSSTLLSKQEKEVLSLLMEGLKYTEIASILGKKPKSVDNTIQRIRTKVRNLLFT